MHWEMCNPGALGVMYMCGTHLHLGVGRGKWQPERGSGYMPCGLLYLTT